MLKKIYQELVAIKEELQTIRSSLEFSDYSFSAPDCNADNLIKKDVKNIEMIRGGT